MVTREICKICYEINRVGFSVPDSLWLAVAPEHLHQSVICLRCFTRLADEGLYDWDKKIEFYPVSHYTHVAGQKKEPVAS